MTTSSRPAFAKHDLSRSGLYHFVVIATDQGEYVTLCNRFLRASQCVTSDDRSAITECPECLFVHRKQKGLKAYETPRLTRHFSNKFPPRFSNSPKVKAMVDQYKFFRFTGKAPE